MSRRVVILSSGHAPLARLLRELEARGAPPHAVMLYSASPLREWRKLPPLRRALGLPLVPARWMRRRLRTARAARALRAMAPVIVTGPLNGARMVRDLRRLAPDVLLLAGCGVVAPRLLAIPREGTVNVHAALLPWVRGNGALEHSVLRGVPPGCTAHWVDAGIDTGPMLERRLVPLAGGETQAELRRAVADLWVEMASRLAAAAAAAPLGPGTPQRERLPLCRAVREPGRLAEVAALVAAGAPRSAFERWKPGCDPRDLSLAPAFEPPAPVEATSPQGPR